MPALSSTHAATPHAALRRHAASTPARLPVRRARSSRSAGIVVASVPRPSPGRPGPPPPAAIATPDNGACVLAESFELYRGERERRGAGGAHAHNAHSHSRSHAPTPPPTTRPSFFLATATTPAPAPTSFTWRSAWYPVALASSLDTSAPAQISLLGTEVVLWHAPPSDSAGEAPPARWNAALDACPHRLAALSSGRLEGGILSCRYHGWEFAGDGRCVANPQAADARAEATVCASSRARLATLPCTVTQGLVWVWPTPGRAAAAQAAATPLPLYPETDGSDPVTYPGSSGEWGFQVAPVDWVLMAENSLDPSHAPFLHEKVMGPATRAGAAPCVMKLEAPGLGPAGFTISHGGYTKKQLAEGMAGVREFTAPGRLRAEVREGKEGRGAGRGREERGPRAQSGGVGREKDGREPPSHTPAPPAACPNPLFFLFSLSLSLPPLSSVHL